MFRLLHVKVKTESFYSCLELLQRRFNGDPDTVWAIAYKLIICVLQSSAYWRSGKGKAKCRLFEKFATQESGNKNDNIFHQRVFVLIFFRTSKNIFLFSFFGTELNGQMSIACNLQKKRKLLFFWIFIYFIRSFFLIFLSLLRSSVFVVGGVCFEGRKCLLESSSAEQHFYLSNISI